MLESQDERAFRDSCRRFAAREIAPRVEQAERSGVYPRALHDAAGRAGLLGITAPEAYGGTGASLRFLCIAIEECARVCAGLATGIIGLGQRLLPRYGTEAQKARYLRPTISGELASAFALTEPGAGSDVLAMQSMAVAEGEGWRLKGQKIYTTGAPFCDYMIVAAYTDRDRRRDGVSLFLVDSSLPGIEIHKMDKLGHRSMETGSVFFDCLLPAEALLGERGKGMRYVMDVLEEGRITHAARSLGVACGAFDLAVDYARQREAFGRPINQFQAIEMKLAQMAVELRSARLHVYSSAAQFDAGEPALTEACMAKLVASEAAVSVTDAAMRIFAGAGYINDAPVQRFFRDARLYPITEGTSEIQLRTIARSGNLVP